MSNKLIGISVGGAVIALLLTFLAYSFFSNRWVSVVEGNLSESAKSEIESKLMEWGQSYRVKEENGAILILAQEVVGVRSRLEALGLPAEQKQGFEVFDDSDYGLSDFVQNVNYRRALEAELERSIRRIAGITAARVHLTLKRESIFKDKRVSPKASVIVRLEGDHQLTPGQIHGLQKIVSSGVEGLDADSVVVANESGIVISGEDYPLASYSHFQDVESTLRKKIEGVVSTFLSGAQTFSVALTVDVNMDRVQSIKDAVLPVGESGTGLLIKKSQQTNIDEAGKNIDGVQESHLEEEYAYSREKSEVKRAVGKIDHISVAVVVDGWISEEERIVLENIITAAGGLSKARNDSVVVAVRARAKGSTPVGDPQVSVERVQPNQPVTLSENKSVVREQQVPPALSIEETLLLWLRENIVVLVICVLIVAGSLVFAGYVIAASRRKSIPKLTDQERQLLMEQLEEVLVK